MHIMRNLLFHYYLSLVGCSEIVCKSLDHEQGSEKMGHAHAIATVILLEIPCRRIGSWEKRETAVTKE